MSRVTSAALFFDTFSGSGRQTVIAGEVGKTILVKRCYAFRISGTDTAFDLGIAAGADISQGVTLLESRNNGGASPGQLEYVTSVVLVEGLQIFVQIGGSTSWRLYLSGVYLDGVAI